MCGLVLAQYVPRPGLRCGSVVQRLDARAAARRRWRATAWRLNVLGFFAVALLSGSLADRLRSAVRDSSRRPPRSPTCRRSTSTSSTACRAASATADPALRILTLQPRRGVDHRPAVRAGGRPADRRSAAAAGGGHANRLQADLASEAGAGATSTRTGPATARGDRDRPDRDPSRDAARTRRAAVHVSGRDDIKKLERDSAIQQRLAAVGEMAAGIAHEIRNPLASMSGLDPDPAPGTAAQQRAGAADGHRAARVRAAEHDHPVVSRLCAAAAVSDRAASTCGARSTTRRCCCATAPEVHEGHEIVVDVPDTELLVRGRRRARSSRSSGTSRPTGCGRCPTADGCMLIGALRAGVGRRGADGARRGHRHPAGRARTALPAVPRHLRQGQRPRAGDRPPHRDRLQRRDSASVRRPAPARPCPCACPARRGGGHREHGAATRRRRRPTAGRRASWSSTTSDRCASCWRSCCAARATRCCSPRTAAPPSTLLEREPVDLLISDIKMPDLSGVDVLRAAKQIDQDILGIMITAFASTETAVEAMRLGACDYLSKPFDIDLLKMKVREKIENRQLRQENVLLKRTLGLVAPVLEHHRPQRGDARRLQDDRDGRAHQQHDPADRRVWDRQGPRRAGRSISTRCGATSRWSSLNCGAHAGEPARVGAVRPHARLVHGRRHATRRGCSRSPRRGTVFLDEIGEMSAVMQVKLLRVLQERRFRRVGGLEELQADIRVIAATNQDLTKRGRRGAVPRRPLSTASTSSRSSLPPLRERREDIPLLAEHFLAKLHRADGEGDHGHLARGDGAAACSHDWPGNIRELENVMERAVALEATPDDPAGEPAGDRIRGESPRSMAGAASTDAAGRRLRPRGATSRRSSAATSSEALERAGGVQVRAAELLGMSFRSFRYYVKKYNLALAGAFSGR